MNRSSITTGPYTSWKYGPRTHRYFHDKGNPEPRPWAIFHSLFHNGISGASQPNPTLSPLQWQGQSPIFRTRFVKRVRMVKLIEIRSMRGKRLSAFYGIQVAHVRISAAENQNIFLPNFRFKRRDKITSVFVRSWGRSFFIIFEKDWKG